MIWPLWECLDYESKLCLMLYERQYFDPRWEPPQYRSGIVFHSVANLPDAGEIPVIMRQKPHYEGSRWRT
jgi:hypothetical protein